MPQYRVTMLQTHVYRITSESLQKRTGVFSLEHYLASRTLLCAGHVVRMHKNRLPKRLMLSWIPEPRVAGGQEMTNGRSLQRQLAHFNLPTAFTKWAPLAQDRASLRKLVTEPPLKLGKPFVRQTTKRRHQGDPGGQAAPGGTARGRNRTAAGGLQRHQQLRR